MDLEVHLILRKSDGYHCGDQFDPYGALRSILSEFRALRVPCCQITFDNTDLKLEKILESTQAEITGGHSVHTAPR